MVNHVRTKGQQEHRDRTYHNARTDQCTPEDAPRHIDRRRRRRNSFDRDAGGGAASADVLLDFLPAIGPRLCPVPTGKGPELCLFLGDLPQHLSIGPS